MQAASNSRSFSLYAKLGFQVQRGAFKLLLKSTATVLCGRVRFHPIILLAPHAGTTARRYHNSACYLVERARAARHATDQCISSSSHFLFSTASTRIIYASASPYRRIIRVLVARKTPPLYDRAHNLDQTEGVQTNRVTLCAQRTASWCGRCSNTAQVKHPPSPPRATTIITTGETHLPVLGRVLAVAGVFVSCCRHGWPVIDGYDCGRRDRMRGLVPRGLRGRQRVGPAGGHRRDVGGRPSVCNVSSQALDTRPIDGSTVSIRGRGVLYDEGVQERSA